MGRPERAHFTSHVRWRLLAQGMWEWCVVGRLFNVIASYGSESDVNSAWAKATSTLLFDMSVAAGMTLGGRIRQGVRQTDML